MSHRVQFILRKHSFQVKINTKMGPFSTENVKSALKMVFLISATSESNEISHQQHQQQPPAQPQIVASKASRTDVWLSFWLMSTALSLSLCALRD